MQELRDSASTEQSSKHVRKGTIITDYFGVASEMAGARIDQDAFARDTATQLQKGGVGFIPAEKGDNIGRFVFENYNSLALWKNRDRVYELNKLLRKYDADCALGVEVQVQWDLARKADRDLRLDRLILPGKDKRVITSHNRHEAYHRSQFGGTSIATFDRLSQFVLSSGVDPHGLGRWSWMRVGAGEKSTILVVAYLPCSTKSCEDSNHHRFQTVYNQHGRYFRSIGDNRCPRTIYVDHLGQQLALWKSTGENIVLFTDANSDVYKGILATRLLKSDIRMTERCKDILGHESPNSHFRGSLPISGIFSTSGVNCVNVFQSAHGAGIGDHRLFVMDIDLASMIGEDFPKLVRLPGRKLQASKYHPRKSYVKSLRGNIVRHKITERYDDLRVNHHSLSTEEKQTAIDKLDRQKCELMEAGEKGCRKIRKGDIPHSPSVSEWIKRLRLFNWMLKHKESPLRDPRNLYRKCYVLDKPRVIPLRIRQPREYSIDQVKAQIKAIEEKIEGLRLEAPERRLQHLRARESDAKDKGHTKREADIKQIIQRESLRDKLSRTSNEQRSLGKVGARFSESKRRIRMAR